MTWALRAGGWLGVGNDPVYVKSRCFGPFPFPDPDAFTRARIADLAERLDRHRKEAQAANPEVTLTQMYNVLEKLRSHPSPSPLAGEGGSRRLTDEGALSARESPAKLGEGPLIRPRSARPPSPARGEGQGIAAPSTARGVGELTEAERRIFDDALILILKELHDELDGAVAEAYGWRGDLSDDDILARLVALNRSRATEEAKGLVRWLRPDYQIPRFGTPKEKQEQLEADLGLAPAVKAKASFPPGAVEQTAAVMASLASAGAPLSALDIAQGYKQGRKVEPRVKATLASLARTGFIAVHEGGRRFGLRRAG